MDYGYAGKLLFINLGTQEVEVKELDDETCRKFIGGSGLGAKILFENMVIAEILKETMHRSGRPNIYFWRDHKGREIDCVIESPDVLKSIEIKSSQTIRANFFDNLSCFEGIAKDDKIDSTILSEFQNREDGLEGVSPGGQKFLTDGHKC